MGRDNADRLRASATSISASLRSTCGSSPIRAPLPPTLWRRNGGSPLCQRTCGPRGQEEASNAVVVEIGGTTGRPDGSIYHSRGRWRAATRSGTCGRVLYVLGSLLRPAKTTQGRAFKTMLNGVSAARRTLRNPAPSITPRSRASPACAPTAAPTSRYNEDGTQISVDPTLCMRPTGSGLSSSLSLAIGSAAIHAASGFSARRTCAATPARCRGAHVSRG
jgi:hypothetical protein